MVSPEQYDLAAMPLPQETVNPLTTVIRFLQSMLRRKWIVMGWLTITVGLGITYFVLAPRLYESSAELLILHTGEGNMDETQQSQRTLQDHLPTYTKVLSSEEVLKGTLQRLPRDQQAKFLGMSKRQAIGTLRENLSVSTTRQTNLLSVNYRTTDPKSAAIIVTEILNSYFAFM